MARESASLQHLLKFSLKLTDQELREWPSNQANADPEKMKWLKEAMAHALEDQDLKKLKKSLEILNEGDVGDTDQEKVTERAEAMEEIQFLLDMDHNATDLHLLGGFSVINRYLKSPVSSLQWRAAEIFAEATQNKPVCQLAAMDIGAISQLLELVKSTDVDMVKVKSIYALSCIIKNCQHTTNNFFELDGVNILANTLNDKFDKVRIKAAFLLLNLTFVDENDQPAVVQKFVTANIVPKLIACLKQKHKPAHQYIANLLHIMVSKNKQAILECRMPDYGLKKTLIDKRDKLQAEDPEQHEEEIRYYGEILQICFQ